MGLRIVILKLLLHRPGDSESIKQGVHLTKLFQSFKHSYIPISIFHLQTIIKEHVNMLIKDLRENKMWLKFANNGPLTRYVKLWVAHAPGMPGTFSPPPTSKETSGMHHGTCVTHVPWCMSGSLTNGGGENVPGIPGACATRNFTYLARGPCCHLASVLQCTTW